MNLTAILPALLLAILYQMMMPCGAAAGRPQTEKEKIEALIAHVEGLKGATFIRNGTEYDAATAGKFLRGKWKANDSVIKTAADFIARAASVSSTSGKPYLIRLKNGNEMKCGEHLKAQLLLWEKSRAAG